MENKQLLHIKEIANTFIGKDVKKIWDLMQNICAELETNYFPKERFTYSRSKNYNQIWYIKLIVQKSANFWDYSSYDILRISYKKKKGSSHNSWFGGYCDWTFSDFEITLLDNDNTLEEAIKKAKNEDKAIEQDKEEKLQKGVEIVKHLMKQYNKPIEDISKMIDYIKDNYYYIRKEIEKENEQ